MATVYARQTVLHNVSGRLDYISSTQRQENLLGYFDGAADRLQGQYWETMAQESRQSFAQHGEHTKKAVEGRELVIKLSNSLLDTLSPRQICQVLAISFEQTYHRPAAVALHYNRSKSNLHAHLVYSERQLLPEPIVKMAPRNLFFDEEGKRRYKRKEIMDKAGELRPGCRIVPKGAVYEKRFFGPADPQFHFRTWLETAKEKWLLPLLNGPLQGDTQYQIFDYSQGKLPQQHVGRNLRSDQRTAVREYNKLAREYNKAVDDGYIFPEQSQRIQERVMTSPDRHKALSWELRVLLNPEIAIERQFAKENAETPLGSPKSRETAEREDRCKNSKEAVTGPHRENYGHLTDNILEPEEDFAPDNLSERLATIAYDLAQQYDPKRVKGKDRNQQIALAAQCIESEDNSGIYALLVKIKLYGDTEALRAAAEETLEVMEYYYPITRRQRNDMNMEL